MLRGMDKRTFEGTDSSVASTWFGLRHARLKSCSPSTYSGFEIWELRFRDLGASFSSFGWFVFEFWVLRFRVLGASFSSLGCFVLRSSFSSASFSKLPFENIWSCTLYPEAGETKLINTCVSTVRDSRIRSEMSWSSIHTKIWTLKQLHHCTQRLNHENI